MRNSDQRYSDCSRCRRKVCCCPPRRSSCLCPPGPTGPQGPAGPAGSTGPTGPAGSTSEAGTPAILKFTGITTISGGPSVDSFFADGGNDTGGGGSSQNDDQRYPVGESFIARRLTVRLPGVGTGEIVRVTLRRDVADTGLTLTFTDATPIIQTIVGLEPYVFGETYDLRAESTSASALRLSATVDTL